MYLVGVAAFTPSALAASVTAPGTPGGQISDPVVRQVDIARPAIVRMITTLHGSLTVHFEPSTQTATFPIGGGGYTIELSGTGAFISSHGDLLTADHVANPPQDASMADYLYQLAAQDIANYVNTHFQTTQPYTANDVLYYLETGTFPSTPKYDQPSTQVFQSIAYSGPVSGTKLQDVTGITQTTVDKIEAQSSFEASDVAIVHVPGMDDMPTISLGDSSQVTEQDDLTIIGFPGNGDVSNSPTNLLTSSINRIYVSAIKSMDNGDPVIEVSGNVEHGDSGGPALDSRGNIVGVVSFNLATSTDPGQTAFLQPSNAASSLIQSQNIDTTPGPFEKAWTMAFDDYSSSTPGHWHKAAQELQTLSNNYKGFVGIAPYVAFAQTAASHERTPSTSSNSSTPDLLLILGIVIVLIILAVILLVVFQSRKRSRLATAGPAAGSPATPYNVYGGYAPANGVPLVYRPAQGSGNYMPMNTGATGEYAPPPLASNPGVYPPLPESYTNASWYEQSAPYPVPVIASASGQLEQPQAAPRSETPEEAFARDQVAETPTGKPVLVSQAASSVVDSGNSNGSGPLDTPSEGHNEISNGMPSTPVYTPDAGSASPFEILEPTVAQSNEWKPEQFDAAPLIPNASWEPLPPVESAEKTIVAPVSSWNFVVPRRPATGPATNGGSEGNGGSDGSMRYVTWIAPCGHLNIPDAQFCRVCGRPVRGGNSTNDLTEHSAQ